MNRILRTLPVVSLLLVMVIAFSTVAPTASSQTITNVVDAFNPAGTGGNLYSAGQITNVWMNWFGNAFTSLSWDGTSDANSNPGSGSMKINANFNGSNSNQFEVFDGFSGITPPLSAYEYTNFQCDVRFDPSSATVMINGVSTFGDLQFGIATPTFGQDYFGGIIIPTGNTNWVHVSIPLNAVTDTNLTNIADVLIHIYGPNYNPPGLSGTSTLWVDNIEFVGSLPGPTNCVVNWNDTHQVIDGFGASSAWMGTGTFTSKQADIFFSTKTNVVYGDHIGNLYTNNGVGLSFLRSRIVPAGSSLAYDTPSTVENEIMQWAQTRGARVWSTPWTPAAGFKTTSDIYDTNQATGGGLYGGSFAGGTATNLAYANQLANYVAYIKNTYGINLYGISIQNEPDAAVNSYEACQWTNTQVHDFVTNLFNALAAQGLSSTKIMLPESQNWQDYQNLAGLAMSDSNVLADVGILADHDYDGLYGPSSLTKNTYGKPIWETEVSNNTDTDDGIDSGVYYAQRIFLFMTQAQANAWHYWWLYPGLLDTNAAPTKRLFTIGNYSRFVRPGFYRIGVTNNAQTQISAYKDPNSGNFAIVAINSSPFDYTQTFNLSGFNTTNVTPWITSASFSLSNAPAVAVTNATFVYDLPAMSVITFAGQANPGTPTISIHAANGHPALTLNGPTGWNYTLWSSTNLLTWQSLLVTNPSVTPLMWTDPTPIVTNRYYRVSLGQ